MRHDTILIMRASSLCLLVLLIFFGCNGTPADREAIHTVAMARQKALTAKDLSLYLSLISRDYHDKGKDFSAKKQELESVFASFDRIAYRSADQEVKVHGDTATITGTYTMRITSKGRSIDLEGKEEIRLRKEQGTWKIIGGL